LPLPVYVGGGVYANDRNVEFALENFKKIRVVGFNAG
jgi:hypothetical protein